VKTYKPDENIEIKLQLKGRHMSDLELVKQHLNEDNNSIAFRLALRNMANNIRRDYGMPVAEEGATCPQ
jgi:hypothetical protein